MVVNGQPEEGLTRMKIGLEACRRTGARPALTQILIAVAQAHGFVSQYEEAFRVLAEAEAFSETSDERAFAAEGARVRGMLLLRQAADAASRPRRKPRARTALWNPPPDPSAMAEAEASMLRAFSIAQQQGAQSWELRAATSLATLWKREGKSRDGRELLAGVVGWFTEGADTADVRNAKTLLAELG